MGSRLWQRTLNILSDPADYVTHHADVNGSVYGTTK